KRPYAYQWQEALHRTFDRIIPCTSPICTWHSFVATPSPGLICPWCKQPLNFPQTLPFMYLFRYRRDDYQIKDPNAHYVVGWPGRRLYQWHSRSDASPIYSGPGKPVNTMPQAIFEYEPNRHQWHLKNLALNEMCY